MVLSNTQRLYSSQWLFSPQKLLSRFPHQCNRVQLSRYIKKVNPKSSVFTHNIHSEYEWEEWKFKVVREGFWDNKENLSNYLKVSVKCHVGYLLLNLNEWLIEEIGDSNIQSLSCKQLYHLHGRELLKKEKKIQNVISLIKATVKTPPNDDPVSYYKKSQVCWISF